MDSKLLNAEEPAQLLEKFELDATKLAAAINTYCKRPWQEGNLRMYIQTEIIRATIAAASMTPLNEAQKTYKQRFLEVADKLQSKEFVDFVEKQLSLCCRILYGEAKK